MSPALALGCPDTPRLDLPCKPRVRAGMPTPRGLSAVGVPSHVPVEAPCSMLAVDTAEERRCPCNCGSAMLRAGDKQLREASWPYQPQGALELSACLITTPPIGRVARGGWARGLRSGHAQAYATPPGPPDLVVAHPPERSLGEEKGMKVV